MNEIVKTQSLNGTNVLLKDEQQYASMKLPGTVFYNLKYFIKDIFVEGIFVKEKFSYLILTVFVVDLKMKLTT